MALERDSSRLEILGDRGEFNHGRERGLDRIRIGHRVCRPRPERGCGSAVRLGRKVSQRKNLPVGLLTVDAHRGEGVGRRKFPQRGAADARAVGEIGNPSKRAIARDGLDDALRFVDRQAAHEPKPQSDRRLRGNMKACVLRAHGLEACRPCVDLLGGNIVAAVGLRRVRRIARRTGRWS